MNFQNVGGLAGLFCAASYLFGFALLVTILAPLGFGTTEIDAGKVVEFAQESAGLLILWNSVIYILNALALALLGVALCLRLHPLSPIWAGLCGAFGLIWATLVLGAGMIANVAVERAAHLAEVDFDRAVRLWETLHAVELGLGGGNEIAGGVWIACVSLGGWITRCLGKFAIGLGLLTGVGGFLTLIPALGDAAGVVFGLGAIAWFIAMGVTLMRAKPTS